MMLKKLAAMVEKKLETSAMKGSADDSTIKPYFGTPAAPKK